MKASDAASNLEYIKKEDGTLSVKRYLNNMVGEVFTIPSEYEGMAITSIESEAFIYFRGGEIHIPASISSIGDQAFLMCYASIFVEEDNSNYTSVEGVLFNKDMTTLISCPSSKMGIYTVPDTVTVISDYAFSYSNPYLYSINLPNSIQKIGEYAFALCSAQINIEGEGSKYKTIDGVLFNEDITTLISCPTSKQDDYTVPDTVTHIDDYAFQGCNKLTKILLPANLTEIGKNAFLSATRLSSITVNESNNNYASADGVLFNKDKTILIHYPEAKAESSYEIPNTVNTISELAFFGSEKLESITIPGSVTTIGANAFRFAVKLTNITIPESITAIPEGAFSYCFALSSVTLPSKLISIEDDAFSFCTNLTKIEIPASIETISSTAFRFAEDEGDKGIIEITVHKSKDSIPGAPWSAENATVIWKQD